MEKSKSPNQDELHDKGEKEKLENLRELQE